MIYIPYVFFMIYIIHFINRASECTYSGFASDNVNWEGSGPLTDRVGGVVKSFDSQSLSQTVI